ncbi:CRISPR-associated endonuclease Cas3'' [Candidatus Methylomicrobium oryzae]|jgi:CRISPR-associated endonuclease/helicase Cas3|uniref:CRISPR-associated endonuclease Cas3'' n=1 Tax=Candidatus Methylomicrobium oryzae TaxID=2802053 RepID=UPI0019204898|nr:CRISPR-associated endonuclease Cas3'' [Methylomicrobium sp. RS1]MBL1263020.1 CRISPR-associated endonuclease Cas3'' [Methylomicrobium sp. RS1]
MMVTFVSQCRKKALNRTRRVLDAFANRIGDNTWQTVITEEGLIAVKTLLRKTATKNTAVACHWIRSRSRSELVWIVGNRDQFNAQGIVPVNSTSKELIMDIPSIAPNPNFLYANTHLQSLAEHLFAVGFIAEQLLKRLIPDSTISAEAIFVAGCLHDLGKIDPAFQEWVRNPKKKDYQAEDGQHIDDNKFSFDKHPRHNEISVLLYQLLDPLSFKGISTGHKIAIKHVIYWHHAKPYRKEKDPEFSNFGGIYKKFNGSLTSATFEEIIEKAQRLLKQVSEIDCQYRSIDVSLITKIYSETVDLDILDTIKITPLPSYKSYEPEERIDKYCQHVTDNALNNVMRACVISADRLISALPAEDLHDHVKHNSLHILVDETLLVESNLCSHITTCLGQFPSSERSHKQGEIAQRLNKASDVAVLAGPAGCGKTKIALEWSLLKNAKQIIWICPRVQVCQGLFLELISERYLPDTKIEINTGEFKYTKEWGRVTAEDEYFSGDIVITTIDQVFSAIITHTKVNTLINVLNAHVVFDEFHEYIPMPAFNLLFAELTACKKAQGSLANTLLVSATPHYFYLKSVLEIQPEDIIEMPSFNPSGYRVEFKIFDETQQDDSNPLYRSQNGNSIVISNTAQTAQKSFICNQYQENAVLLHSKFKKSDKQIWFNEVYDSFKKDGTRKFDVLRAGPIVQASLNITCDSMVSEITTAENFLQRLGRLDRFGTNSNINIYNVAVPESIHQGKGTGAAARFLARQFCFAATKAWYQFLQAQQLEGKTLQLPELYRLYRTFHNSELAQQSMGSDLLACFKQGVQLIGQKIVDPITIPAKKITDKGRGKISKYSLRGENRFVQMAVCDVSNPAQIVFCEKYAYEIPVNERDDFDNLTASLDEIQGYGDSDKNLLAYMKNKHHNVIGGQKAYKDFILLNEARDPEFPIYLSYTPAGLDRVGGDSARHSHAIYYAVCDRQPIGAISIKQLTSNEE